jgi:hypothetical protein
MPNCWSAAASTGTVDETARNFVVIGRFPRTDIISGGTPPSFSDSRIYGFGDAIISLTPNAPKGAYSVRYNVTPVPDPIPGKQFLQVRYLVEDHDAARVVVLLKKYNLSDPPADELAEIVSVFDSRDHPLSPEFQLGTATKDVEGGFNFVRNAYFMEALLIKDQDPPVFPLPVFGPGTHTSPALAAVRICGARTDDV